MTTTIMALALLAQAPQEASCPLAEAGSLVETKYDKHARAKARRIAGRHPHRWILPGSAVTQDWVPSRLNIEVGDDGVIHRVTCG